MKKLIKQPIEAMAIINPRLCRELSIQVELEQSNEGPIPHLHVYLDKTRNPKRCAYIRLDEAGYSPHHESAKMSKKNKKDFLKLMHAPNRSSTIYSIFDEDKFHVANGYETAVNTWIDTYPGSEKYFRFDQEGFPVMPDYENSL